MTPYLGLHAGLPGWTSATDEQKHSLNWESEDPGSKPSFAGSGSLYQSLNLLYIEMYLPVKWNG